MTGSPTAATGAEADPRVAEALRIPPPLPRLLEEFAAPDARVPAVRRFLAAARGRAADLLSAGAGGGAVVAAWTRFVDHVVVALQTALARELDVAPDGTALFALGGYGRAELSPHSDLDLLVVYPDGAEFEALVEGLLYPLWDAGLTVQCVARTVEQNVAVARTDLRSRTSLLEARLLAGDQKVAERFDREVVTREIFGREVRAFVEAKLAEMEARHRRYGDTVYVLEPNVKEGEGGLRDIQTALWVAKVRYKVRSGAELLHKGVLPPAELEALETSRDFLLQIRNHLHLLAGRREDRLTYEYQDDVAPRLGFTGEAGIPAAERLLQAYYDCANRVGHFTRAVCRRAGAGLLPRTPASRRPARQIAPGIRLQGGEIHLGPRAVRRHPLTLLAAFEVAQAEDAELSPQALEVVRENLDLVDDRYRRDPEAVALFLRILRHPRRVATTLMRMHDVRFLDRFIPEFGKIFGRVQRDLYHTYPADVHSLFAVQELRRLARGEYEEEFPLLTGLVRDLERPGILYLAALLHDVGKGEGHAHDERGSQMALAIGDRMGLETRDLEYLVLLVGKHLLLSHTAQGRDLHDEDLIAAVAAEVGDPEALKMLYLLTFADIRAVGPGAWNGWRALLLRELYEKTAEVLEKGPRRPELATERARDVRDRLRLAARGVVAEAEVERFLAGIDHPQYLLTHPVEALLRHLTAYARRGENPVLELRPVPEQGYTEALLVTRDRPGLFAQVTGLMAAHRLNILSAGINTRTDGWALDVLHVSAPLGEASVEPERWERWQEDLRRVFRGAAEFDVVVGPRLRRRPGLRRPRPRVSTRVRVDNEASRRFTVVDLQAADRLGLLHDAARALFEQGLSIHLAKITTNLDRVADSFYVEVVGGGKLTDPQQIARLEKALAARVAGSEEQVP